MARGTTKEKAKIADRAQRALGLRKAGFSYRAIAVKLEASRETVRLDVENELRRLAAERQDSAEELRQLELERLDGMQLAIAAQVRNGNFGAIDRALRIMERRAKLLGLDMPVKTDITSGGEALSGLIINLDDHD